MDLLHLRRVIGQTEDGPATVPALTIGRYHILGELAHGGMGVVYRAHDPALKRAVALKVLKEGNADPRLVARLHREAATAAKLRHPNIVTIHEVGEADGLSFIAMDLIEGGSLRQAKLAGRALVQVLEPVARAVHFAHQNGVIHRDLKPDNVLLESATRPLVADFGLARVEGSSLDLTRSGGVLGTPLYMAPEQVRGETAGPPADIYALGVILYESLAGRLPFDHPNIEQLFYAILDGNALRPSGFRDGVDRDLENIAMKAMSREPADRYATAEAMADDLKRWLDGVPVLARPLSPMSRAARWTKRRPAIAALAMSLLALALFAGWTIASMKAAKSRLESVSNNLYTLADGSIARFDDILMGPPRNLDRERAELAKAAETLRAIYAENPRLHEALIHIGRIETKLRRFDDAQKSFDEGLARLGDKATGAHHLSRALLRMDEIFDPYRNSEPGHERRIEELSKLALRDIAEARRRSLTLPPAADKYVEALARFVSREAKAAAVLCDEILAFPALETTFRADVLRLKALCAYALGDGEAARRAITEAIVIKRSDAAMLVTAATLTMDARPARDAATIAPRWAIAWLAVGAWSTDDAESDRALDQALALDPKNPVIRSERASKALKGCRTDAAIRESEESLALDPANRLARMTLAEALSIAAETDAARRRELADRALAMADALVGESSHPEALHLRGLILHKLGAFAFLSGTEPDAFWHRALDDFQRAQEAGPFPSAAVHEGVTRGAFTEIRTMQGRSEEAAKFAADAEACLDRGIPGAPSAMAHQCRAKLRLLRSNFLGALEDADAVIALEPRNAMGHAARGDALLQLARWKEAAAAYDRAMELDAKLAPLVKRNRDYARNRE